MKRLVNTVDMPKEEWLRFRKGGITGTDAGSIVGMNPYKSAFAVYQDKISEGIEQIDNEAMRQGRDLEEYVAQRFEEETGFKVRRANAIYYNEEHPFMLADFDRIIVGLSDGIRAGLECKTVSAYSADKWENENIPLHYQLQVQHYLAVSGFDCWYVAALIFGRDFIIRKIDRDEELIQMLISIEERFWKDNVLARVMPDPDGSSNYTELLNQMYFKSDKEQTIDLRQYNNMLSRRNEIDELIKKLETEKTSIDQTIKLELGEAAYGMADDYKVSWSSFEQSRLDSKRLKSEHPDIYDEYTKTSSGRRFTVTRVA